MKRIATITDKDITGSDALATAEPRIAVDAILFDRNNNIALLHLGKYDIYTIPGGGVDPDEDLITAIKREVLEETGYKCDIICDIGTTFENRAQHNFTQKRHYYIARVIGEKGELQLTDEEISEEITVCWHPIEKALQLIVDDNPSDYVCKFVRKRNIAALTEVVTNHAHVY